MTRKQLLLRVVVSVVCASVLWLPVVFLLITTWLSPCAVFDGPVVARCGYATPIVYGVWPLLVILIFALLSVRKGKDVR